MPKSHGPFWQHTDAIRILVVLIATVFMIIMLTGCAFSPRDGELPAQQRTIVLNCIFASCEIEHADNTHGPTTQSETPGEVPMPVIGGMDPLSSVISGAVEGVVEGTKHGHSYKPGATDAEKKAAHKAKKADSKAGK